MRSEYLKSISGIRNVIGRDNQFSPLAVFIAAVASSTALFHYITDSAFGAIFPVLGLTAGVCLTVLVIALQRGEVSGRTLFSVGAVSRELFPAAPVALFFVGLAWPNLIPLSAKLDGANHLLILQRIDGLGGHYPFLEQGSRASLVAWGFHGFVLSLSHLTDVASYKVLWLVCSLALAALFTELWRLARSNGASAAGLMLSGALLLSSPWTVFALLNFDYWPQIFATFQLVVLIRLCRENNNELLPLITLTAAGIPLIHPMFLLPVAALWLHAVYSGGLAAKANHLGTKRVAATFGLLLFALAAYVPAAVLLSLHFRGFSQRGSPLYIYAFRSFVDEWQLWIYPMASFAGVAWFSKRDVSLSIVIWALVLQGFCSLGTNPRNYIVYKSLMCAVFVSLPITAVFVTEILGYAGKIVRPVIGIGGMLTVFLLQAPLLISLKSGVPMDLIEIRRLLVREYPRARVHVAATPSQKKWLEALVEGKNLFISRLDRSQPWVKSENYDDRSECIEILGIAVAGDLAIVKDSVEERAFAQRQSGRWVTVRKIGEYSAFRREVQANE